MELIGREGWLTIDLLEDPLVQISQEIDLKVSVSAKVGAFAAEVQSVWLEWPEVKAFRQELRDLNGSLKGKAEISAMSPNEFWLKLEAFDSKGHIGVKFSLGKSMHTDNGQFENQMFGGFEVEPGAVKSLYQWLTDIIAKNIGAPRSRE